MRVYEHRGQCYIYAGVGIIVMELWNRNYAKSSHGGTKGEVASIMLFLEDSWLRYWWSTKRVRRVCTTPGSTRSLANSSMELV
mmetsp:Transcript_8291/g.20377  ORF Transcript_8291/g.20377 Transcript_8291/m.20377 type:complete len:83 (+) Transcript_8291:804-1052(+)